MTTTRTEEGERSVAQAELYVCLHCTEVDLPAEAMEPLADGTLSNCCKPCWADYKEARAAELPAMLKKWHDDLPKEEAEAKRREVEKQLSKSEKEKVAAGKHSLTLVK